MNGAKKSIQLLLLFIVTYVFTWIILFGVALIPAMGMAWIIKTFFVIEYTFWQIAVSIAIGLSILGGRFK